MGRKSRILYLIRNGTSALAIGAMVVAGVGIAMTVVLPTPAVAEEGHTDGGHEGGGGGHDSGGGQKGPQYQGGGERGGGHGGSAGGHDDVTVADEDGEDGPSEDARGPHYGQPDQDEPKGGPPVWAGENSVVDDVELGRLNVARSPGHVLLQALGEAEKKLPLDFYDNDWETVLDMFEFQWDTIEIVDSPLENLALLKELAAVGGYDFESSLDDTHLMAIFLGVASDKNLEITDETVEALFQIFSKDIEVQTQYLSDSFYQDLADLAEDVRLAVLAGHG